MKSQKTESDVEEAKWIMYFAVLLSVVFTGISILSFT